MRIATLASAGVVVGRADGCPAPETMLARRLVRPPHIRAQVINTRGSSGTACKIEATRRTLVRGYAHVGFKHASTRYECLGNFLNHTHCGQTKRRSRQGRDRA